MPLNKTLSISTAHCFTLHTPPHIRTPRLWGVALCLLVFCVQAHAHGPEEDQHSHHQAEPVAATPDQRNQQPLLVQYTPSGPDLIELTSTADSIVTGQVLTVTDINNRLISVELEHRGNEITVLTSSPLNSAFLPSTGEKWAFWVLTNAANDYQSRVAKSISSPVFFTAHGHRGQMQLPNQSTAETLSQFLKATKNKNTRQASFIALGSQNPELVEDGIRQLFAYHTTPSLLSEAEFSAIASALNVEGNFRQALLNWLGQQPNGHTALNLFTPETGSELLAWLAARASTGSRAHPNELLAYTKLPEASFQAAALSTLIHCQCSQASYALLPLIAEAGDPQLQHHSIQLSPALGEQALPYLAQAVLSRNIRIKKSAGSAITQIGGQAAEQTLYALATSSQNSPEAMAAKAYSATTLYIWLGPDHALIARLSETPEGNRLLKEVRENPLPIRVLH